MVCGRVLMSPSSTPQNSALTHHNIRIPALLFLYICPEEALTPRNVPHAMASTRNRLSLYSDTRRSQQPFPPASFPCCAFLGLFPLPLFLLFGTLTHSTLLLAPLLRAVTVNQPIPLAQACWCPQRDVGSKPSNGLIK